MFQGVKRLGGSFLDSILGNKETPEMTDFRDGIEAEMAKDERLAACPETRMVSNFFEVAPEFNEDLFKMGFRTENNEKYDIVRAAAFIGDIDRQAHIEDGRAVPFLGIEQGDGSFRLLDVSNFASSHRLKDLNGDAARRMVNTFRNLLEGSSHTTKIEDAPDRLFFAPQDSAPQPELQG